MWILSREEYLQSLLGLGSFSILHACVSYTARVICIRTYIFIPKYACEWKIMLLTFSAAFVYFYWMFNSATFLFTSGNCWHIVYFCHQCSLITSILDRTPKNSFFEQPSTMAGLHVADMVKCFMSWLHKRVYCYYFNKSITLAPAEW